jgi:hypothetical protein
MVLHAEPPLRRLNPGELTFERSLTSVYVLAGRHPSRTASGALQDRGAWAAHGANPAGALPVRSFHRLQLRGRNDLDAFEFPLTQSELADILGLSTVHVNRVLQVLRSRGLIEQSTPAGDPEQTGTLRDRGV